MPSRLRRSAAVSVLVLFSLAGCSGDGGSGSDSDHQAFEVPRVDVEFELPEDWEEFDQEKAAEVASDPNNPFIERLGMEPAQFEAMLQSQMELFVTAPHARDGFLDNVNVIVFDEEMPSAAQLEMQFRSVGATDIESDDLETEVGDGHSVDYTISNDDLTVHGNALVVEVGDSVLLITTSASDGDDTDEVSDHIAESLTSTD